jgi:hypothetical protein
LRRLLIVSRANNSAIWKILPELGGIITEATSTAITDQKLAWNRPTSLGSGAFQASAG